MKEANVTVIRDLWGQQGQCWLFANNRKLKNQSAARLQQGDSIGKKVCLIFAPHCYFVPQKAWKNFKLQKWKKQSWALEVFLNFFNNKKWSFAFFIKLIWLGVGFLNRTGAEIDYLLYKKCKTHFLLLKKCKNTESAQLWKNCLDAKGVILHNKIAIISKNSWFYKTAKLLT